MSEPEAETKHDTQPPGAGELPPYDPDELQRQAAQAIASGRDWPARTTVELPWTPEELAERRAAELAAAAAPPSTLDTLGLIGAGTASSAGSDGPPKEVRREMERRYQLEQQQAQVPAPPAPPPRPARSAGVSHQTGIRTLAELRAVKGMGEHTLALNAGWPLAKVLELEALELRELKVDDLVRYVEALGMAATISIELVPMAPLTILSLPLRR